MDQITKSAKWAASEYEIRTRLIAVGKGKMSWMHPTMRVNWGEICRVNGIKHFDPSTDIDKFNRIYKRELKKRGLLDVYNGKIKSDQWLAKQK
jgi:hypothetical protein